MTTISDVLARDDRAKRNIKLATQALSDAFEEGRSEGYAEALATHECPDVESHSRVQAWNTIAVHPFFADCLYEAPDGSPCIEARTTGDLEASLGMRGGDIFHGALEWPWADDDEPLDTPAARWGVATAHERVLLCGSGARRGGAVSGIGGHNAAMAALELLA